MTNIVVKKLFNHHGYNFIALGVLTTPDFDGDGLTDDIDPDPLDEVLGIGGYYDNDGMTDDYEVANGLYPVDAQDAGRDKDGDGYDNRTEHDAQTDPSRASSNPRTNRILLYLRVIHGAVGP